MSMRHDLGWTIAPEPGDRHDRAEDLLAALREANPPMLSEQSIIAVISRHLDDGDEPTGEELLDEIWDHETAETGT